MRVHTPPTFLTHPALTRSIDQNRRLVTYRTIPLAFSVFSVAVGGTIALTSSISSVPFMPSEVSAKSVQMARSMALIRSFVRSGPSVAIMRLPQSLLNKPS
ncbi:unannotated protein [freshwater metagenome]|uniref:Unannotated protein n=1 Tax=freshwater metagenome TaxID=449393 RepID=A0A6J7D6K4_9ZZZZ